MINSPQVPRVLTPLDQNTVKHSHKISLDLSSLNNHNIETDLVPATVAPGASVTENFPILPSVISTNFSWQYSPCGSCVTMELTRRVADTSGRGIPQHTHPTPPSWTWLPDTQTSSHCNTVQPISGHLSLLVIKLQHKALLFLLDYHNSNLLRQWFNSNEQYMFAPIQCLIKW